MGSAERVKACREVTIVLARPVVNTYATYRLWDRGLLSRVTCALAAQPVTWGGVAAWNT